MFSLDLLPLSEPAHLNLDLSDLEWAASTADAAYTTEPSMQAEARSAPAQSNSSGSAVEPLDNILPANRGLHYLTLLSKGRPPVQPRSAASADADTACQRSSTQAQTDAQSVDKVVVQREKNKRAQKRHRDRLRAREEQTSQQIMALTAELKKSQREKGLIEQRAHTLSTALAYRANPPEARVRHIQLGHNYQYWPESGWIPEAVLRSTLHLDNMGDCSSPRLMTAEQVKVMSVSDHQDHWRLLVFRLAILIPQAQGRLDNAAGIRLQEVMLEHHMRVACVATFNFASFQALATSNMETRQQVQGQVPADKWRSVVAAAELTEAQERQIFRARRLFYQHFGVLTAQRAKVAPWVQGAGSQTTFPGVASQFVTSQSAMKQLQENMLQEQNLFISLLGSVWRRIFTTMQCAILMVQAYPMAVDLVSVMNCLAEDAGEPSAGDLMADFASGGCVIDGSCLQTPNPDLLIEAG